MKTYLFDNGRYYRLHAVCELIGLTYNEVYHNYDKWQEPLGLIRRSGHIYCYKTYADSFIKNTPGYVPLEYYYKRNSLKRAEVKSEVRELKRKVIRKSIWIKKHEI